MTGIAALEDGDETVRSLAFVIVMDQDMMDSVDGRQQVVERPDVVGAGLADR